MPIRLSTGEIVTPTTKRLECPTCLRLGGEGEMLRVTTTRPIEPPQVYERDYRCAKCGYTTTARYVLPRHEDDYLSDDELAARAALRKARSEQAKARWALNPLVRPRKD